MGLSVRLEWEDGTQVAGHESINDSQDVLHKYVGIPDASRPFMSYIDWYADTTFNSLQVSPFIVEWTRISEDAEEADTDVLLAVLILAHVCEGERHIDLKFYGD